MKTSLNALSDQHTFVVRAVRGLLADPSIADDATQDAWLRALRTGGTFGVGWLTRAAKHAALDRWRGEAARSARERRRATERGEVTADAADEPLLRVERRQRVATAVLALAEPLRDVVLLRYEE